MDETITLLNGEVYGYQEILAQMYDDEFYYGHLGKYALSSSSLKTILKSPKTYRNIQKYGSDNDSTALALGKLFHWMVLEPHKIDGLHFVDATTKNTKKYKDAKAEYNEVFLTKEKSSCERLADALLRNEATIRLMNNSEFEVPEIKMIEDIAIRGKADILKDNHIIDLKTTQDLNTFRYSADKYGYDLQAYLYMKLFDVDRFTFLVVDKNSTDIAVFECSDEFIQKGERKFKKGVDDYKYFFTEENDLDQYVLRGTL